MLDYNRCVETGIALLDTNPETQPDDIFFNAWFNTQEQLGEEICNRHIDYKPIHQSIISKYERKMNGEEVLFDEEVSAENYLLQNNQEFANDADFIILFAAQFGILDNSSTAGRDTFARLVECAENAVGSPNYLYSYAHLAAAMWYADYKSFRSDVLRGAGRLSNAYMHYTDEQVRAYAKSIAELLVANNVPYDGSYEGSDINGNYFKLKVMPTRTEETDTYEKVYHSHTTLSSFGELIEYSYQYYETKPDYKVILPYDPIAEPYTTGLTWAIPLIEVYAKNRGLDVSASQFFGGM